MKKINFHFYAIFLMAIVFSLMESCVNKNDVNPVVDLTGKIKTSRMVLNNGSDTIVYDNTYRYDSLGKLKTIQVSTSFSAGSAQYTIEYRTNKVIVTDSALSGVTFYLKSGTNLIDSMINYDHGNDNSGTKVTRDNSNNISKIEPARPPGSVIFSYYYIDSFTYDGNNNLTSYKTIFGGPGSSAEVRWNLTYDLSKPKRVDNDYYLVDNKSNFTLLYTLLINDFGVFGISLGNTCKNAISSANVFDYGTSTTTLSVNYHYLENTAGNLTIDFVTDPSNGFYFKQVENTYY